MNKTLIALTLVAAAAQADTPIYPTYGTYSPTKPYTQGYTFPKKGNLVTLNMVMRFDSSISDYISCEFPGMVGAAGSEKVRFSVSFSETKTVTVTGYVPGTTLQINCASEGLKLKPVALEAALTAITVDSITRR